MGKINIKKPNVESELKTEIPEKVIGQKNHTENIKNNKADQSNIIDVFQDPAVLTENKKIANANSRTFFMNNGTLKSVISASPVNFYDDTKQRWRTIDNSLKEVEDGYEAKFGKYKARISKTENGKEISIAGENCCLKWGYLGKIDNSTGESPVKLQLSDLNEQGDFYTEKTPPTELKVEEKIIGNAESKSSKAIYKNVEKSTDIEYIIGGNNVKENIIVREKSDFYKYVFDLQSKNLKARLTKDNTCIEMYSEYISGNEKIAQKEFIIPCPYMYDSEGTKSNEVYYELEQRDNEHYRFTVVADADWINDNERAFPVIIDPQIITSDNPFFSFQNYTRKSNSSCGMSSWVKVNTQVINVEKTANREYKSEVYIDLSQEVLPAELKYVSDAKLILTEQNQIHNNCIIGVDGQLYTIIDGKLSIDLTTQLKQSTNKKITFTLTCETMGKDVYFASSGTYAPQLNLEFLTNDGVRQTVKALNLADAANGRLNLSTGDFSVEISDIAAENSVGGISVSHIYKKSGEDFSAGQNFRLNLHEKLERKTSFYPKDVLFFYTDAFGEKHGFKDYYYYFESDGKKRYLDNWDKSSVKISSDGRMSYNDKTIYVEYKSSTGLQAIMQIDNLKHVKYYEQRSDEYKDICQKCKSYKDTLSQYKLVNSSDGVVDCCSEDHIGSTDDFETFIEACKCYCFILLTESEYIGYKNLLLQIQEYQMKIDLLSDTDVDNAQKNIYLEQISILELQKKTFMSRKDKMLVSLQDYYKDYVTLLAKKENYEFTQPVNFLTDGKVYKGYNKSGNLVSIYDLYGNYTVIDYEEYLINGIKGRRISRIYDQDEKTVRFDYNTDNKLTYITDIHGNKVAISYTNNQLTKFTHDTGKIVDIHYSDNDIINIRNFDEGVQVGINYANSLPSEIKTFALKDGNEFDSTYSSAVLLNTLCIDYLRGTDTVCFDNVTITEDTAKERLYFNGTPNLVEYRLEKNGMVVDAKQYENVSYWTSSESDKPSYSKVIYAKRELLYKKAIDSFEFIGQDYEETIFNQFNKVEKSSKKENIATDNYLTTTVAYTYDDTQRLIGEECKYEYSASPAANKIVCSRYNYDSKGNLVRKESFVPSEVRGRGIDIEETVYDAKGRVLKTITYNSLDTTSKFYSENEYSDIGEISAQYNDSGEEKTEIEYDSRTGKVRSKKSTDGRIVAYGYDKAANVTGITQSTEDGIENSVKKQHSGSRLISVQSGHNKLEYEYDDKHRVTKFRFNGLSRPRNRYIDKTDTTGEVVESIYRQELNDKATIFRTEKDLKGNITSVKHAYGSVNATNLNYSELYRNLYDEQNRLIEVRDGSDRLYVSNIYDAYGKLTTHRYGRIKVDSTYDSTGLKTSDKYEYATDGNERKYDYEYASDSSRRLKKLTTDNYKEEYETDGLERTTKVKKSFGNCEFSERYGYYKNGDHATTRINTITYGKNGVSDGKVTYTYDKFGNIISVNENGKQRSKYAFDAIGRLVSEKDIDNNKEICYNYDSQGNIEAKWLPDGTVKRYCYQEDSDLLIRFGSERFEYDQLGNPTVYRDMTCTWNLTRLLTSVKDGTNTINFEYDIFGRRTRKFCNDSETVFEYDENNLIRQIHNGKTTEFIYGKNGIVGFVYNNKTYYFRKNIFGDVERIYNDNGTVVGRYSYSAFGECEIKLDTDNIASLNPIRYRGYYFDDELGLYYLQSRYYDPEIGRFISADSIEYADPEHVNGLNLYAYCNNNPVTNVDPNGNKWWNWVLGGLLAVTSIVVTVATAGATAAIAATVMGALVGALYGGASAYTSGQNVILGAITGGIAGIIMGNFAAVGTAFMAGQHIIGGILCSFGGGALGGGFSEISNQINNNGEITSSRDILISAFEYASINLISATIGIPLVNESGMLVAVTANYVFDVLTGIVGFIIDYFRNSASKNSATNYLNMFLSRKYVR